MKLIKPLIKNWFSKADRLNKVRNKAAHSYNPIDIYEKLGFNGKNAFEQSKNECLKTIKVVLGVK